MALTNNDIHGNLREYFKTMDLSLFYDDSNYLIYSYDEVDQFDGTRLPTGYWYELKFIKDTVKPEGLGTHAKNEWKGLMQINICVMKSIKTLTASRDFSKESVKKREYDEKMKTAIVSGGVQYIFDNAYAAIAEVMKRGVYINGVRIIKVYNSSAIDNDDYYTMPVTVEWLAHLNN